MYAFSTGQRECKINEDAEGPGSLRHTVCVEKAGSGGWLRESCVCCCREGTAKFEAICGCPYNPDTNPLELLV